MFKNKFKPNINNNKFNIKNIIKDNKKLDYETIKNIVQDGSNTKTTQTHMLNIHQLKR